MEYLSTMMFCELMNNGIVAEMVALERYNGFRQKYLRAFPKQLPFSTESERVFIFFEIVRRYRTRDGF